MNKYKSNEEIVENIDKIWIKNPNKLKDIKDYIINIRLQDLQAVKEMVEESRNTDNICIEADNILLNLSKRLDELMNK